MPRPRFSTLREQAKKHFEDKKASDFFASGMQYRMREEPGFDKYDRLLSDQTGATLLQYLQNEVKDSQDKTALLQTFHQDPHFAWLMFIQGYNHECRIMSRNTASQNTTSDLFDLSDDGKTLYGIKDKTIKHVIIPDGVEEIDRGAFATNKTIEHVSFPDSLICIHVAAFRECTSLKEVVFANGLRSISVAAFYGCSSLKEVILPQSICEVFEEAFIECSSLENVVIPDFTVNQGWIITPDLIPFAFGGKSLKSIHIQFKDPVKAGLGGGFRDIDYDHCTLYVPKGTEASYRKQFYEFKFIVGE